MGVKCVFMALALSPLYKYWRERLGERVSLSPLYKYWREGLRERVSLNPLYKYWREGVGGKGIFKSFI